MNRYKLPGKLLFLISVLFIPFAGFSQITSSASAVVPTEYSSGPQDNIYVFCGAKGDLNASLTATLPAGETGTFEWQKYNASTGTFDFFSSDVSGNTTSTISNLTDGGYRVKETTAAGDISFTAWAFNNYITATAEIPQSDCNSFTLKGAFDSPVLTYTDLPTGQPKEVVKNIQVKWMEGSTLVSSIITAQIYTPPTKDTNYSLEVSDRFGCTAKVDVMYTSIVTKAIFTASVDKGEAPLEVTFNNASENGTSGKFEWFIFKDVEVIKKEAAANKGSVIDSIMVKLYDDSPKYTFENSGSYKVKLVSKKVSELMTCYDTVYYPGYIVADTSFVDAPNVFTPNGDGVNDAFIIKFWSMKQLKISIFNRWGKLLHVWESGNVINFVNTVKSVPQSVWDGKVGGKYCTPGGYRQR
jgi:gliding motility-associated-like protein